jgi:hypothetical protein
MSCKKCIEIKTPIFTGLTDSNGVNLYEGDYIDFAYFYNNGENLRLNDCRIFYDNLKAAFICVGLDKQDDLRIDYLHNVNSYKTVKTDSKIKNLTQELLDFLRTDLWHKKYQEYLDFNSNESE